LLTRALINLIDNATKHSPAGGRLDCSLRVEPSSTGADAVCVISDEGEGIAIHQLRQLFQRFQRGDADAGGASGVGLGLNFVETVVHRHGGTITCDSTVGKGSAFTVRLPLADWDRSP